MNPLQSVTPQAYPQSQQLYRQYGANALLPEIHWQQLFPLSKLDQPQIQALNTLYRSTVPLALQVFEQLKFDVFAPPAYHPQGLGLFDKLALQEKPLIDTLVQASEYLSHEIRHQIWSMLLRGGAVLVFKAWLGKAKTGQECLDTTQLDELSDLLFIRTPPLELAARLAIDPNARLDHVFLMDQQELYLDRFNCLETAALFVDLDVYDAAFLSLRDEQIAEYLKMQGYVTQDQINDLECALNPLYCASLIPKQNYLA